MWNKQDWNDLYGEDGQDEYDEKLDRMIETAIDNGHSSKLEKSSHTYYCADCLNDLEQMQETNCYQQQSGLNSRA